MPTRKKSALVALGAPAPLTWAQSSLAGAPFLSAVFHDLSTVTDGSDDVSIALSSPPFDSLSSVEALELLHRREPAHLAIHAAMDALLAPLSDAFGTHYIPLSSFPSFFTAVLSAVPADALASHAQRCSVVTSIRDPVRLRGTLDDLRALAKDTSSPFHTLADLTVARTGNSLYSSLPLGNWLEGFYVSISVTNPRRPADVRAIAAAATSKLIEWFVDHVTALPSALDMLREEVSPPRGRVLPVALFPTAGKRGPDERPVSSALVPGSPRQGRRKKARVHSTAAAVPTGDPAAVADDVSLSRPASPPSVSAAVPRPRPAPSAAPRRRAEPPDDDADVPMGASDETMAGASLADSLHPHCFSPARPLLESCAAVVSQFAHFADSSSADVASYATREMDIYYSGAAIPNYDTSLKNSLKEAVPLVHWYASRLPSPNVWLASRGSSFGVVDAEPEVMRLHTFRTTFQRTCPPDASCFNLEATLPALATGGFARYTWSPAAVGVDVLTSAAIQSSSYSSVVGFCSTALCHFLVERGMCGVTWLADRLAFSSDCEQAAINGVFHQIQEGRHISLRDYVRQQLRPSFAQYYFTKLSERGADLSNAAVYDQRTGSSSAFEMLLFDTFLVPLAAHLTTEVQSGAVVAATAFVSVLTACVCVDVLPRGAHPLVAEACKVATDRPDVCTLLSRVRVRPGVDVGVLPVGHPAPLAVVRPSHRPTPPLPSAGVAPAVVSSTDPPVPTVARPGRTPRVRWHQPEQGDIPWDGVGCFIHRSAAHDHASCRVYSDTGPHPRVPRSVKPRAGHTLRQMFTAAGLSWPPPKSA